MRNHYGDRGDERDYGRDYEYGGSASRGYGGYGGGRDYTREGRRVGHDYDEGEYGGRGYGGNYASGYDWGYAGGAPGGSRRRGYRDYDNRPESLMGGGTTGYDPNYAGYGTGRGGYGGYGGGYGDYDRGNEYGRGYDYDRGDRGFRERGRERRGRDEDRGWWDRASDEVASWFGDDQAARRRRVDEQRDRSYYGGEFYRGRGPKGYRRSDERIKEDVSDRLSDHPYLDASDIEVNVENGEVTLSGTADNRHAKRLAEDIAESVSGVTNVENRVRVNRREWNTTGNTGTSTTTGTSGTTGTDTGTTGVTASAARAR